MRLERRVTATQVSGTARHCNVGGSSNKSHVLSCVSSSELTLRIFHNVLPSNLMVSPTLRTMTFATCVDCYHTNQKNYVNGMNLQLHLSHSIVSSVSPGGSKQNDQWMKRTQLCPIQPSMMRLLESSLPMQLYI